jgi:hypothetical protein
MLAGMMSPPSGYSSGGEADERHAGGDALAAMQRLGMEHGAAGGGTGGRLRYRPPGSPQQIADASGKPRSGWAGGADPGQRRAGRVAARVECGTAPPGEAHLTRACPHCALCRASRLLLPAVPALGVGSRAGGGGSAGGSPRASPSSEAPMQVRHRRRHRHPSFGAYHPLLVYVRRTGTVAHRRASSPHVTCAQCSSPPPPLPPAPLSRAAQSARSLGPPRPSLSVSAAERNESFMTAREALSLLGPLPDEPLPEDMRLERERPQGRQCGSPPGPSCGQVRGRSGSWVCWRSGM